MNFGFSEDQDMIRQSARDFVKGESSFERIRELHLDERGYSEELYRKMAEAGWLGAIYPEEYGGIGLGFVDLICIMEELGKGILPEPLIASSILAGSAVLLAGTEEQKLELLPQIASGDLCLTLGAYELAGRSDLAHVETKAVATDDGYVLSGKKDIVDNAATADKILVTARTNGDTGDATGITLFIVDRESPGVEITPRSTIDRQRRATVELTNVQVSSERVVGTVDHALPIVEQAVDRAAVALCAEMIGGMEEALRMTIEYAQERVQFGKVIGSFQAVKHKAANMYVSLEIARSSMYYAAMALDQNMPDLRLAVSTAKALCSEHYLQISKEAIQLHGGIGFTHEHDIHLFYKRAIAANVLYGDPTHHRERYIQEKVMGAPAEAPATAQPAGAAK